MTARNSERKERLETSGSQGTLILRRLAVLLMLLAAGILLVEARGIISTIGLGSFTVPAMQLQVYAYRTDSELAESLLILTPVVLLWHRHNYLLPQRVRDRRFTLTRTWKRACLVIAFLGFSTFSVLAGTDVKLGLLGKPYLVGVAGFLSFFAGTVATVGYRIEEGLGKSLTDAIVFVSAPFLIVFELSIWYFFPLQMSWFATTFAKPFEFYGVYLVSNWLVLAASVTILALGVSDRLVSSSVQSMPRVAPVRDSDRPLTPETRSRTRTSIGILKVKV